MKWLATAFAGMHGNQAITLSTLVKLYARKRHIIYSLLSLPVLLVLEASSLEASPLTIESAAASLRVLLLLAHHQVTLRTLPKLS